MEQDDAMEKPSDKNSETNSYVSCYPNTRRYSLAANTMGSTRPLYRTDNQGYSIDMSGDDEKKDTKIDMPTSQPPQYSAVHDKNADKKVKVCKIGNPLWGKSFDKLPGTRKDELPLLKVTNFTWESPGSHKTPLTE